MSRQAITHLPISRLQFARAGTVILSRAVLDSRESLGSTPAAFLLLVFDLVQMSTHFLLLTIETCSITVLGVFFFLFLLMGASSYFP